MKPIIIFLFIISLNLFSEEISEQEFKKGIILLEKDKAVAAEWTKYENYYFIRNKEKGVKLEKEEVAGVVDKEYFSRIQSSSRFKAVGESFYLLSSGRGYQWFNGKTNYWEEPTTIVIKILLLATTVYYYSSSVRANQDVHNSFLGFSSDARIQKFHREYNNYRIAGIATGLFFGYSAIHSFIAYSI